MRLRLEVVWAACLIALCAGLGDAQGTVVNWNVDGTQRQAKVFAPKAGARGERHPLIFAFHGHGGTMNTAQGMGLQNLWPEAIVVYPQGLPTPSTIDPNGLRPGWQVEAHQLGDRDLKFFDTMLTTMRQQFPVDDKRIYATGFSNGAIFSYLLWVERGNMLAALGICAGRLWPSEHPSQPRPVIVIAGQNDKILPFALQQQSIESDRQIDQATGAGQACGPLCTLYPSAIHTPVVTRIHPGGHIYPPWAAAAIVDFFKAHRQP